MTIVSPKGKCKLLVNNLNYNTSEYKLFGAFERKSPQGFSNYYPSCLSLLHFRLGKVRVS